MQLNCENYFRRLLKTCGDEIKFLTLRGTTDVMKGDLSPNPVDFTVQCYGKDGKFIRAFGGMARTNEIKYNGWTSNNRSVKADMTRFRKHLTSVYSETRK